MATLTVLHAPPLRAGGDLDVDRAAGSATQDQRARIVRGQVIHDGTGRPVAGAIVVLLVAGGERARTLADTSGGFTLRWSDDGSAELRADVIGRPSVHVPLAPGDTAARVVIPARTINLRSLASAPEDAECTALPAADRSADVLWTEVRKALESDAWARATHAFAYDLFQYERQIDAQGRIANERSRRIDDVMGGPSRSRAPEEVSRAGFARSTPAGDVLYAPDADVLLAPAFTRTHCFRVREGDRNRIGLAFRPLESRDLVDIEGVFWLNRTTAELTDIRFEYTGLEAPEGRRAGGGLEYARLGDGLWTLSRWNVRTPAPEPGSRLMREEGVEVIRVTRADGTVTPVVPRAALIGTLTDSVGGEPVAGAAIRLLGTDYAATTNADGRFFIPELPGGRFVLRATGQDRGSRDSPPADVRLFSNQATHVGITLRAPPGTAAPVEPRFTALDSIRHYLGELGLASSQLVDSLIMDGLHDDRVGALVGRITDAASGRALQGVLLRIEATPLRVVTEANGTFSFPEVPAGRHVLTAEMLGYANRSDTLRVVPGEIIEAAFGMTTRAIELAPIEVTVRSRWLDTNGFYVRRSGGLAGHFFSRADIERKAPAQLTDLLRDIPGVLVLSRGVGTSSVYFRRVTTIVSDEGARGCEPAIYYDGIPMNAGFDRLHEIAIPFIDGVEVYVGAATPIRFQHPCGVVLIWTRRPR